MQRPNVPGLIDRFGRTATDLRVSLTDRCNLRCTYCMPAEGLDWLPKPTLLTDEEIGRLIVVAVRHLGVTEIRFTGGEPLLRPGLVSIVAQAAALTPRPQLSVTTNGLGLSKLASALRPVKLNAVLMRGINDDEAADLLGFALEHGYELRFIEQMPLDAQHAWRREEMVAGEDILAQLRAVYTLEPDPQVRGAAPAETWLVAGHTGVGGRPTRVGVIASVTQPFCGACDRTRLTADGQVRNCLFGQEETDLRGLLRAGADDDAIADAWRAAMWGKRAGHGIDDPSFLQPARSMSAIGG